MPTNLKIQTPILPGKRIEVHAPELPESGMVDVVIYLPAANEVPNNASNNRYPDTLNDEYNALVKTQWQRSLTTLEAERLHALKTEMNEIDAASQDARHWETQMDRLEQLLQQVGRQIDALPDAS